VLAVAFLASAVGSLALGFWLVPADLALGVVRRFGYVVLLAAFLTFVLAIVRLFFSSGQRPTWSRGDLALALASAACAALWQILEPHGFKVLMDELVVNGTALTMHADREVLFPLRAHVVDGQFLLLGGVVDKRPGFFPFLTSVVHDLTGYRPGNAFVLNGVLGAVLLFLAGRFGRHLGGRAEAGLLAILLLGGLPLLAVNATGGGQEMLNLVMICICLLLARRYLLQPGARAQDALLLAFVLLAQTRYESALFALSVTAVILGGWWRARRPVWSWGLVAAPPLLLLIPWQRVTFDVNPVHWQLPEGLGSPFAPAFIPDNLAHAARFLFIADGVRSSSPVLATAGLASLLFLAVLLPRRWRLLASRPALFAFAAFVLVVLLNFALLMSYHWGQLDDFQAQRLALPLLLVFALASSLVAGRHLETRRAWKTALALPALWLTGGGVWVSAGANATRMTRTYQEIEWQRDFVRRHSADAFFVQPAVLVAILERRPAITVAHLQKRAAEMDAHLDVGTYRGVYVVQRLIGSGGAAEVSPESRMGPAFELETLEERRIDEHLTLRVSRLVGVDLARHVHVPPPVHVPVAPAPDAGAETWAEWLQNYLRTLP
jgi:hypothetical protein